MKIIFLDIDGVLNSWKSQLANKVMMPWGLPEERLVDAFDPDCINNLKEIIVKTNASIVISSSWRKLFSQETLIEHFKNYGITNIIDVTPNLLDWRGNEIQDWLNKHKDVDKFVILDDDNDMVHLSKYLVQTNWKMGLEEKHVKAAIEMLNS